MTNITGLPELQIQLSKLQQSLQGKDLQRAATEAARVLQAEARARAPRSSEPHLVGRFKGEVQPGNLAENIVLGETKITGSKASISVVVNEGSTAETNAFYWRFLEYGTKDRPATPFMRPAFESAKAEAAVVFEQHIKQSLDKLT